jgi:hypothetical protein
MLAFLRRMINTSLTSSQAHWKHRARRGNRLEGPLTNADQLNHIYLHVSLSRAGHTCNLDITTSEPAALTIGELRAQAGRMLDVRDPALDIVDPSRLRLYLRGEELSDVSMSVEGAGLRFDGRNDLWYTVDQRDFGAQMMDNLDPLGREVETLEKRLADMESAGEGYVNVVPQDRIPSSIRKLTHLFAANPPTNSYCAPASSAQKPTPPPPSPRSPQLPAARTSPKSAPVTSTNGYSSSSPPKAPRASPARNVARFSFTPTSCASTPPPPFRHSRPR